MGELWVRVHGDAESSGRCKEELLYCENQMFSKQLSPLSVT